MREGRRLGPPPEAPPGPRRYGDGPWGRLLRRAEACPKCGARACRIGDRILSPGRGYVCPACGCRSHTPVYTYLFPVAATVVATSLFYLSPAYLRLTYPLRELGYIGLVCYVILALCAVLIVPLKERGGRLAACGPSRVGGRARGMGGGGSGRRRPAERCGRCCRLACAAISGTAARRRPSRSRST